MNAKFLGAVVAAILVAKAGMASVFLNWDSETESTNVAAGTKEARFVFCFTNVLSTDVIITNVHPSCGCTTAQLPPLPWAIQPGTNGHIGINVNISGKTGSFAKTVEVGTDHGSESLMVKITVNPPTASFMSASNRLQNEMVSRVDRQAVFKGDCARCHANQLQGRFGKQLYETVCAVCHEATNRASMVPNLHTLNVPTDETFWRTWISYGRQGSLMPAFAKTENGPLTVPQIDSLVGYLKTNISQKPPASQP